MNGMDEIVALYGEHGRPVGSAPRSRVRAENLHHGATAIVVLDPAGRLYVHRRTDTKDVFPGMYDVCAGGVLLADEDPYDGAVREVAEELGVTGMPLTPIFTGRYSDEHTSYTAFGYVVEGYDGAISWQPEEVAWGDWWELAEIVRRLDDPLWPLVPDSRALVGPWLRERGGQVAE
ncbi:NUDIX domain-containing protein [Mumia zhuanghuii]|uniref:NUDIX domain-containing protein n=2 Tax=Mumia TaxID=1546255 RepID=A0A5Q6RQ17_9ACTN|nr:NUDIX domain-containing protein [Mumia zhuanghuii]